MRQFGEQWSVDGPCVPPATQPRASRAVRGAAHAPIRPIFRPARASARSADWAPGPGDLVLLPPVARILMCSAVMPSSLHFAATSCAASIAAYGDDSSRSAFTFIPPVTLQIVSLPEASVTWTKVSLNDA